MILVVINLESIFSKKRSDIYHSFLIKKDNDKLELVSYKRVYSQSILYIPSCFEVILEYPLTCYFVKDEKALPEAIQKIVSKINICG